MTAEDRVRTTRAALHRRFGGMLPCRIILEAGTHAPSMSRLLTALGHEALVVNPRPGAAHRRERPPTRPLGR